MATQINNTASATYNYGSARVVQDSASSNTASTNLITEYAISGYKEALNPDFRAGENITFLVHIANDGTQPLYNVTISDDLGGAGTPLSFVTGSASLNLNGTNTAIAPTTATPLSFVLPSPLQAGGLATITYVSKVSSSLSSSTSTITNTATIQANEGSASGNVISVTPSPSVTLSLADFADVSITKNVSANTITIGETYSYILTLTNSGNLDATGVVITDILPTNFAISSITSLTNGVQTTFTTDDYNLNTGSNTLTLPSTTSSLSINVPASTTSSNGTTIITITGSITA